jgi:CheY-like chemotaxis protein
MLEQSMSTSSFGKCPYYRESENASMGKGLGYCDLGGGQAICEGDVQFCEKAEELRKQLLEEEKKKVCKDDNGKGKENEKSSNYRVLVVDDQESMLELLATLFSKLGHPCVTAKSGTEALNKMIQNRSDAVIADIVMPEMDGITLTKKLLSLYPKLPIMVMTGYSKEYPAELAIEAGAREFIKKPFSIDELILRFNKMMRDHEMLSRMEAKQNERVLGL